MGWTGTYTTENVRTVKGITEFFKKHLFNETCNILASNCKNNVWYGALEYNGTHGKEVTAYIIKYSLRNDDGCNFFYKAMNETEHPYYYDASDKVMNCLTPIDSDLGNEWRKKVKESKEKTKKSKSVKVGDIIEFTENFSFSDGTKAENSLFILCERGFFAINRESENKWKNAIQKTESWKYTDHGRYLITKWKQKEYSVLGNIFKTE